MELSFYLGLILSIYFSSDLSRGASVNVSMSSTDVAVGGTFNIGVQFEPKTNANNFVGLKCGYEIDSSVFEPFVEYNTFETQLKPLGSSFPTSYVGRLAIVNKTTILISNVKFEDEGTKYHCELQYYEGGTKIIVSEKHALANVYAPPVFGTKSLANASQVVEGRASTLSCNVTSRPASNISWSYDSSINGIQTQTSTGNGHYTSVIGTLNITNPQSSLNGKSITCTGIPKFGASIMQTTVLDVLYLPKNTSVKIIPANPLQNEFFSIECSAVAKPNVTNYRFYLNDTYVGSSANGAYRINATDCKAYTGNYKCTPENSIGIGTNATENAVVRGPVRIVPQMVAQQVNETQNVTITCLATGCPDPAVKWTRNGSVVANGSDLMLTNVTKYNSGTYTCFAKNYFSNHSVQFMLTVNYKPVATAHAASTRTPLNGTQVTLNCSANAYPTAMYRFYRLVGSNQTEESSSGSNSSGILVIPIITADPGTYAATYKCAPYNLLGDGKSKNVLLDVQVPPKLAVSLKPQTVNESGNASFECKVTAANPVVTNLTAYYPSMQMLSLVNGLATLNNVTRDQNGTYSCKADNGVGSPVTVSTEFYVNYKPWTGMLIPSTSQPLNGGTFSLTCSAVARPKAHYRFYRYINSTLSVKIYSGGSGVLNVSNIDYVASGGYAVKYRCIPFNMLGDGPAMDVQIDIQVPPQLKVSENVTVNEGGTVFLTCAITAANPAPNITWMDESSKPIAHVNGNMTLRTITKEQAGKYSCKADNGVAGSPVVKAVTVTVNYAPLNTSLTSASSSVNNGSAVTLTCSALALPAPEFIFYETIGGNTIMVSTTNSNSTGVLQISSINTNTNTYKTTYKCMPKNALGNGTEANYEFNVLVEPSTVKITSTHPVHVAREGNKVTFNCSVLYGNPTPTIKWTSSTSSETFIGSSITFPSVNRINAKTYTCTATNSRGNNANSVSLDVQYAPEIMTPGVITTKTCETRPASVKCMAGGNPKPMVSISFGNINLTSGRTVVYHNITTMRSADFGTYTCSAQNTFSTINATRIIQKTDLPGAVTNVASKVDKDLIEVSWTAPVCKGISGIYGYVVKYKKAGGTDTSKSVQCCSLKITGLESGVKYTISVAAVDRNRAVGPSVTMTADKTKGERRDNKVAIYAGIGGGILLLILLIIVCWFFRSRQRRSEGALHENGGIRVAYGDPEKNGAVPLGEIKGEEIDYAAGPQGDLYARVSKKDKDRNKTDKESSPAYGGVDNSNFVRDSDGAYDPVDTVKPETPEASPAAAKKAESNYAELSSFKAAAEEAEKPKAEKTEYASIDDLGPLKAHEESDQKKTETEDSGSKVVVSPEKDADDAAPDSLDTSADLASSRVNLI